MIIKQVGLAAITVSDLHKAKSFFVDMLGLKISTNAPEYGWLELVGTEGGSPLGVGQENPQHGSLKAGTNAIISLSVDNLVQAKQELEAKGVIFFGDIIEISGEAKMIFFADPDGNKFLLVENIRQ